MHEKEIACRIGKIRKQKGFSLENMALELNISTAAYRKVEQNDTHLTIERLLRISKILNISIIELLDLKSYKTNLQKTENSIDKNIKSPFLSLLKKMYEREIQNKERLIEQYKKRLEEKDQIIRLLKNR